MVRCSTHRHCKNSNGTLLHAPPSLAVCGFTRCCRWRQQNLWIGNVFFFSVFQCCRWGPPSPATRETTHKQQLILILFFSSSDLVFLYNSFSFRFPFFSVSGGWLWDQGICSLRSAGSVVLGLLLKAGWRKWRSGGCCCCRLFGWLRYGEENVARALHCLGY